MTPCSAPWAYPGLRLLGYKSAWPGLRKSVTLEGFLTPFASRRVTDDVRAKWGVRDELPVYSVERSTTRATLFRESGYLLELEITPMQQTRSNQSDRQHYQITLKDERENKTCLAWHFTAATHGDDEFGRNISNAINRCRDYFAPILSDGRTNFESETVWQSLAEGWRARAEYVSVGNLLGFGEKSQRYFYRDANGIVDLEAREDTHRGPDLSWDEGEIRMFEES